MDTSGQACICMYSVSVLNKEIFYRVINLYTVQVQCRWDIHVYVVHVCSVNCKEIVNYRECPLTEVPLCFYSTHSFLSAPKLKHITDFKNHFHEKIRQTGSCLFSKKITVVYGTYIMDLVKIFMTFTKSNLLSSLGFSTTEHIIQLYMYMHLHFFLA